MRIVRYNGKLWRVVQNYGAIVLLRSLDNTTATMASARNVRCI